MQYTIYVTVTNHAADNPESDCSNIITVETMAGAPLKPGSPHLFSVKTSVTTMLLAAPFMNDQNGPISYVDFVVHFIVVDSSLTISPASTGPSFPDDSANGSTWYTAARFTFDEYSEAFRGGNFILGNGSKTVDRQGITYTNQPLVPGRRYTVFCRVIGTDRTGRVMSATSDGIAFLTTSSKPEIPQKSTDGSSILQKSTDGSNSSDSTNVIIVATVLSLILLIVTAVFLTVIIKLRRGTGKLQTQNVRYRNKAGGSVELVDTGHDVVYDDPICVSNQATCMSMTTPRDMAEKDENKSNGEGYEGLCKWTREDGEHAYQGVGNEE